MDENRTRFEWNSQKRLINIEKHRIDFRQPIAAFEDPQSIEYVSRGDHDEQRCVLVGLAQDRLIAVIYAVRSAKNQDHFGPRRAA